MKTKYRIWTDGVYFIPEKLMRKHILFFPRFEWELVLENTIKLNRQNLIDWFIVNNIINDENDLEKDYNSHKPLNPLVDDFLDIDKEQVLQLLDKIRNYSQNKTKIILTKTLVRNGVCFEISQKGNSKTITVIVDLEFKKIDIVYSKDEYKLKARLFIINNGDDGRVFKFMRHSRKIDTEIKKNTKTII